MTDTPLLTAAEVDDAAAPLEGVAIRTPLQLSHRLSALAGARVWLKREDLQPVRSYKLRGAHLFLSGLEPQHRDAGVVAASAGNHAQGVALACRSLGIRGRIYVPGTTPRQKRERITALGGDQVELILTGETFDDAAAAAALDARSSGATLVPPFDDLAVMAGQGTVIREAVEQLRDQQGTEPEVVVLPVGGGGLLAGCGTWLREHLPHTRIVGVEPAGAASMAAAVAAGEPVELADLERFVDGAAVRRVGIHTLASVQAMAPELLAVPEGAVCTEMLALYQTEGIIAEPAGALAAAAVATGAVSLPPVDGAAEVPVWEAADGAVADVIVVISGGNNDVSRYNEVVERSLVHEGLKHYFLVTFAQEPGALRRFLDQVLGPDDDIVLFDYIKRNNREEGPALVGLELGARENLGPLLERMEASPMQIERIDPEGTLYRYLT
ncbi:threonine ammonia-lyase IlvA [Brachybacterium sp. EF45031]|uniref:threonine ammonia-lyase IlvA n=1 Tax=Brachybacterium sillae TaxID=2810536 RepID=UPI00217EFB7C|nr:threonine ammonia-lyase IlvA [Brachybacterium sillae]MCS6712255.1 threonine ammonia-lyase IlvA [Brachybacterium sillae]